MIIVRTSQTGAYLVAKSRFCVWPFTTGYGTIVWMISDATWITDAEVRDGRTAPVVAQFDNLDDAFKFCWNVTEGKITTTPHEAWFLGWPELPQRVAIRDQQLAELKALQDAH